LLWKLLPKTNCPSVRSLRLRRTRSSQKSYVRMLYK
jgi:hypothetical protein